MSPPGIGMSGRLLGVDGGKAVPPPPLTGMQLWLRGDVGLTFGGTIAWADQSGHANNYDATLVNGPTLGSLNGLACPIFSDAVSALFFNGPSLDVIITDPSAWTVFAAWQYTGAQTISAPEYDMPTLLGEDNGDLVYGGYIDSVDTTKFKSVVDNYPTYNRLNALAATAHVSTYRLSSGLLDLRVDGASAGAVASANTRALFTSHVGGHSSTHAKWAGPIGEVIAYNVALSDPTVLAVEAWLSNRWVA